MAKKVTFWCAERLNGAKKGELVKSVTMKDLANELGMSYSTAKTKRPGEVMEKKMWIIGEDAFEVWFEQIPMK